MGIGIVHQEECYSLNVARCSYVNSSVIVVPGLLYSKRLVFLSITHKCALNLPEY